MKSPERKALERAVRSAQLRVHAAVIKLEAARRALKAHKLANPTKGHTRIGPSVIEQVSEALMVDTYQSPPEIARRTGRSDTSVRMALAYLVQKKRARRVGLHAQRTFYTAVPVHGGAGI